MAAGMGKFILSVVNAILARQSLPFIEGQIDEAELERICRCALTAPYHNGLRPWQFILCGPTHKALFRRLIIEAIVAEAESDRAEQAARVARKLGFAPHLGIFLLQFDRLSIVPEIGAGPIGRRGHPERDCGDGVTRVLLFLEIRCVGLHLCVRAPWG